MPSEENQPLSDAPRPFVFDVGEYDRAGQEWICGGACQGTPCTRGPGPGGECGAVCRPEKIGDRYYCENAASLSGSCDDGPCDDGSCAHSPAMCTPLKKGRKHVCGLGVCADGPRPDGTCCQPVPPCRPRRRVLGRRRIVTLWVLALAIGAALLMVGGPDRTRRISPGELSRHHGAMTEGCAECHTAGEGTLVDWIHGALVGTDGPTLDQRCLECHQEMAGHAEHPHTADPEILAVLTKFHTDPSDTSHAGLGPGRAISCAKCHREHRGADHDLTAMTDAQCQTCHASEFHSFADGHPEFSDDPTARRRIAFDHLSHYGVHFRDAGRLPDGEAAQKFLLSKTSSQATCAQCHVTDREGQSMLVRDFDQSCGACHAEQIRDDLSPGMMVLALPSFDRDEENEPASWPPKHPEAGGTMSPMLRLLLSPNAKFREVDRQIVGLDLRDLSKATEPQRAAARALPGILKKEFADLATQGRPGIERRLAEALGLPASSNEVIQMAKIMPAEYLDLIRQKWVEDQDLEVAQPRTDGPRLRDRDRSLRYRAAGHADPILKAWIDASVRLGSRADRAGPIRQIYHDLARVAATGRCLKCHTIESTAAGSAAVNWSASPRETPPAFTRYAHQPHLVMLGQNGCKECHVLRAVAKSGITTAPFRPEHFWPEGCVRGKSSTFHSNFQPMRKAQCATCHTTGRVRQNCTTCHTYHVQTPPAR